MNPWSSELSLEEAQELAGDEIEIGDMLLLPLPTEDLGRIAAQTAKQILVQKVREAVRDKVYEKNILTAKGNWLTVRSNGLNALYDYWFGK